MKRKGQIISVRRLTESKHPPTVGLVCCCCFEGGIVAYARHCHEPGRQVVERSL